MKKTSNTAGNKLDKTGGKITGSLDISDTLTINGKLVLDKDNFLELLDKKIIKNGKRNTYYLIGKQYVIATSPGNAGQLVLFINNMATYNDCVPAYVSINRDGDAEISKLATTKQSLKNILVYTDVNYDYIFLYAPNYHDNFSVELISNYNVTIDVQEMTESEFNNYVTNMTKITEV